MIALLTTASFLLAPPQPVGCSLSVDGRNAMEDTLVEQSGFTGRAHARAHYELRHASGTVRAWTAESPRLMSLTWRPPNGKTATMTCTTYPATPRPVEAGAQPLVVCLPGGADASMRWGQGTVSVVRAGVRWSAQAFGYELRISASSPSFGFVAVWTDEVAISGNASTLQLGADRLTCWRL